MSVRSETLKATNLRKAWEGLHPASIPLGYRTRETVAEPDPELAPLIRGTIERAADGDTLSRIRDWLMSLGFRTKHGKVPSLEAVSNLVTNLFTPGTFS
jgi:hypothetical protein